MCFPTINFQEKAEFLAPRDLELFNLPEEIILSILNKLPPASLAACCAVSKTMYRLVNDSSIWKGLFVEIGKERNQEMKEVSKNGETDDCDADGRPSPRLWCSTVVHQDKLFLYGGHVTQDQSNLISKVKGDLYTYEFAQRKWTTLEHEMGGKTEHKAVLYDNYLWFVGGYNGYDYCNDVQRFDPVTNTSSVVEVTGEPFTPRSALTAVVWQGKLYTFGGWNGFTQKWFNDVHCFNFETKEWRKVHPNGKISDQEMLNAGDVGSVVDLPPPRTSHASVLWGSKMYTFGGFSGKDYLNDLWEFDLETETWTDLTKFTRGQSPAPRSRFCAAVHGDCMYILGGWNKVSYFADIYCFNFVTRLWTQISHPCFETPSISQYSLVVHEDKMYIFGGYCAKRKACVNRFYSYKLQQTNLAKPSAVSKHTRRHTSKKARFTSPDMCVDVEETCGDTLEAEHLVARPPKKAMVKA